VEDKTGTSDISRKESGEEDIDENGRKRQVIKSREIEFQRKPWNLFAY
jgi:hypothetical protein